MNQISVIGLGNWGTALGNHLSLKGFDVLGWSIEADVVKSINEQHANLRYLKGVSLNPAFRATSSIQEVIEREVVVLVFPSQFLSSMVPQLKVKPESKVVSAIKGLEGKTLLTPLQYFERYGVPCAGLAVLSGPSFAIDIAHQRPSGVVAASKEESMARFTADLFSSDRMRVYTSNDPLGVELGGIVKNVIALAAGVSDGLELGDSARAGLITRGLAEMMRLAHAMGGDARTLSGLSGLGDLVMTASCDTSRNRTVGLRLGRGESLQQITSSLGSIAEAVETTPHVVALANKYDVDMPITQLVSRLLKGEVTPPEMVKSLICRPMKREID